MNDPERLTEARELFRSSFDSLLKVAEQGPIGLEHARQRCAHWAAIVTALEAMVANA